MAYKKSAQKKKQVDSAESFKDEAVKLSIRKKVSKIAEEYNEDDDLEFFVGKEYSKVLCIYFLKSSWLNLKSAFVYLFKYIKAKK